MAMLKNNFRMKILEVYEPKTQSGIGHVMILGDISGPSIYHENHNVRCVP